MAPIFNFRIFAKNAKTLICFYLLNQARPTGYPKKYTLASFQKNIPLPKNGGHFEFLNSCKNAKTQIFFYILNRARQRDFFEIFDPQGILANYSLPFSKKNLLSPI